MNQKDTTTVTSSKQISSLAIPPRNDGSTRKFRSGALGARMASVWACYEGNIASFSEDSLRIEPLKRGCHLWDWVQPLMTSGGFVIGEPKTYHTSEKDAIYMGFQILKQLLDGRKYRAKRPEYAIPVLLVLALLQKVDDDDNNNRQGEEDEESHTVTGVKKDDSNKSRQEDLLSMLRSVVRFAAEPELDDGESSRTLEIVEEYLRTFEKYKTVQQTLRRYDLMAILNHTTAAPTWKEIQQRANEEYAKERNDDNKHDCKVMSNKTARYIHRVIVYEWPEQYRKRRARALRQECLEPVTRVGEHPIEEYVKNCWRLRPSSISSYLPKMPPTIVRDFLKQHFDGCSVSPYALVSALETSRTSDEQRQEVSTVKEALKIALIRKFELFKEWIMAQHGPVYNPTVWSDTLSIFAKVVNPYIRDYNELIGDDDEDGTKFVEVTSFVPYDLVPEMYAAAPRRFLVDGDGDDDDWDENKVKYPYRTFRTPEKEDENDDYYGLRRKIALGYYIGKRGYYYKYSSAWRRDAYCAYLENKLPSRAACPTGRTDTNNNIDNGKRNENFSYEVHRGQIHPAVAILVNALDGYDKDKLRKIVTPEIVYGGGKPLCNALEKAEVPVDDFMTFLQQYYWSTAFLTINLNDKYQHRQRQRQEGGNEKKNDQSENDKQRTTTTMTTTNASNGDWVLVDMV